MQPTLEIIWNVIFFFVYIFLCSETRPSRVSKGEGDRRFFKEAQRHMEPSLLVATAGCFPPYVSHQIQATGLYVLVRG